MQERIKQLNNSDANMKCVCYVNKI